MDKRSSLQKKDFLERLCRFLRAAVHKNGSFNHREVLSLSTRIDRRILEEMRPLKNK